MVTFLFSLYLSVSSIVAVKIINNGLAPPEIVHSPIDNKPRCSVRAAPLDLVFVLDSSGSLRNKFQDEVDVIRRIVRHVTIGETATRVMLIQFSGVQHLEFNFNKFNDRADLLSALDVLRHVSGITRIGGAFEFTMLHMNLTSGMRDSSVPKIVYLLSDGRTHDYPRDFEMADLLKQRIANSQIYAYGTGDYVALAPLLNYTKDEKKIITNQNLVDLEPLFDQWRGTEICEQMPVCVRGTDKPLDLVLVIDSSDSVERQFNDQILFAVERIVQHVNIHPDAVRLALITYSGQSFVHFTFDNQRFANNSAVIRYLNTVRPVKGITATDLALHDAFELFNNREGNTGARQGIRKLVIVLTDGHSMRSPKTMIKRMEAENVEVIAVSLTQPPFVDEGELLVIAGGQQNRVFVPSNLQVSQSFSIEILQDFESVFAQFIGFGCPGMTLNPDTAGRVRGSTDVTCDGNSVTFTVRTQKPLTGLMYAQQYHDDPRCVKIADGKSREVSISFVDGICGLTKSPSTNRDGFFYNVTVLLQFHPLIITRADQALDVSCFHQQPLSLEEVGKSTLKKVSETQCSYRLHRFGTSECVALDAKVGESLFHKWECDSQPNYQYLVHDCFVRSEKKILAFVDSNGCAVDEFILETPNYSKLSSTNRFVFQEMSVFMFPGIQQMTFQCQISLCDMERIDSPCTKMIPPKCEPRRLIDAVDQLGRVRRAVRDGFVMTTVVETRTLNVLENEAIKPPVPVKYCDIRLF